MQFTFVVARACGGRFHAKRRWLAGDNQSCLVKWAITSAWPTTDEMLETGTTPTRQRLNHAGQTRIYGRRGQCWDVAL